MLRMPFWRMFAIEISRAIEAANTFLQTPPDLREVATWGGPAIARHSFRNAFAACWDMLDSHPGNLPQDRWELD